MKKSEAMDLYEGLNGISPKMIEEAGNYKKTASVDIRYKKSNNVKKIMAAGLVAAAAVTAVLGVRELKPSVTESGNQSSNQLASEQTGYKIAHVMNVYAAGLDDTSECIFSNDEKNAGISGVVAGISSQVGDSSVMGQVMAGINVTGKDILKINYSIMGNDSDVTYNLARMKEVDKDSPEYQTSSEKFRKQTENGYAYYIDLSKNYSLVRLNTSNKTLELLYGEKGNKVVNYNVYGNKIFFQVESTDGMTGLYRMNIDGTQIETIAIGNITNIHCTSKYTFFQYYEDQGVLYRVSTSGADTSVEQITIK